MFFEEFLFSWVLFWLYLFLRKILPGVAKKGLENLSRRQKSDTFAKNLTEFTE